MRKGICIRIGNKIRFLRKKKGWTQAMLADHARLTREWISSVERGQVDISILTLQRIVKALDLTMDEFFVGM